MWTRAVLVVDSRSPAESGGIRALLMDLRLSWSLYLVGGISAAVVCAEVAHLVAG